MGKKAELDDDDAEERNQEAPPFSIVSQWPTATKAAVVLGVGAKRLAKLVADGTLRAYRASDRTVRYDPKELETLRRDLDSLEDDSPGGEASEERRVTVELLKAQTEAIRDAHKMIRDLVGTIDAPIKTALAMSEKITNAAIERASALEKLRDEFAQFREQAESSKIERDVYLQQAKAQEDRRTKAFEMAMGSMPGLMRGIEQTVLKYVGGAGGKLDAAQRLLTSFDPGMVASLLSLGVLTEQQTNDLRTVLAPEVLKSVDAILEKEGTK